MTTVQLWRGWLLALAAGIALIVSLGGTAPKPFAPRAPSPARLEMPELPVRADDPADLAELAASPIWGLDAKTPVVKEPPLAWSLAGVFAVNDRRRVTLRFEQDKQPPRHLATGDALPDGRRIKAIERDRVLVTGEEGKEEWLSINRGAGGGK